jgi:hypothetical protein
MPQNPD